MLFSFFLINFFLWGGILSFVTFLLFFIQRFQTLQRVAWNSACDNISILLPSSITILLPWFILQLFAIRGYEFLGCSWWVGTTSSLRYGLFLFCLTSLYNMLVLSSNVTVLNKLGLTFEQLLAFYFLQITWLLSLQSASFLVTILWLELAGLLAILIVGFFGLTVKDSDESNISWRTRFNSSSSQRGLLSSLILLLWVNGFATIIFVWAWGILSLSGLTLCNYSFSDLSSLYNDSSSWLASIFSLLLGVGVLVKFLLPPFQFFLFSFYRLLPISSFLIYVISYYLGLMLVMFIVVLPALSTLLSGFVFLLVSSLTLLIALLIGGLSTSTDLRTTLAFSTLLNLSFLILIIGL